jgi:hypothetical protein
LKKGRCEREIEEKIKHAREMIKKNEEGTHSPTKKLYGTVHH